MKNNDLLIQYILNKQLIQKLKIRKDIFYIQMNVTNQCSDNCWHCYLKKNHNIPNELSAKEFIEILDQIKHWAKVHSKRLVIDLIGGDPLQKPDIDVLLYYLSKENINYGIKGNPYLLSKNIEKLNALKCRRYQMSLDGLESTHDAIRSKGSFEKTLNALKLLYTYKIPANIKYTLSKQNSTDLWPLLNMLYNQDIHISNFSVSRYYDANGHGFHVNRQYYDQAFKHLTDFYDKQIRNHDIRIHLSLKEHLWIPYLSQIQYLFQDFYDLLDKNPYLSSCSMIYNNATVITVDGYFDLCPKISGLCKAKNITKYMEKKEIFLNNIKKKACIGCKWKTICLGCPAFYTENQRIKDCDCFFY